MAEGKAAVRVEGKVADIADAVDVTDIGCGGCCEHGGYEGCGGHGECS